MSQLQANVQLNLPRKFNTLVLTYNTYEKATFDQYLATSIALRGTTKTQRNTYIDELTGKGSLNEHFKKLVDKALEFDKKSLQKILDDSMFPMTKVDKTNKFTYYPDFDISIMNNRIYKNFDKYSIDEIKQYLMLNYDIIDKSIEEGNTDFNYQNYKVRFTDNKIEIQLAGEWLPMDFDVFSRYRIDQKIDISLYKGTVKNVADGDGWILLTANSFNALFSSNKTFIDNDGNHCIITNDYIKETEIAEVYGMYFFKERRLDFVKQNKEYCKLAVNALLENYQINETKTKTLISILKVVDDITSQKVVNYVLVRKDSKEMSLLGLDLLKNGVEKNWELPAIYSFKTYCSSNDFNILYRVNPNLDYTLAELANVDNDLLSAEDLKRKQDYLLEKKNKIEEINQIIGTISSSALRQQGKKVLSQSDADVKKFNKFCNEIFAHNTMAVDDMSDIQLDNWYKKVKEFYDVYLIVQKKYDESKTE